MPQNANSKITDKNKSIILKAAEQAFAQNGYKGTSIKQIAELAGLPKTNVLYYFSTKQTLYHAVLTGILTTWNSRFDKATENDDPATTLADYIREKMTMSQLNPSASKVFAMEIINGGTNLSDDFTLKHRKWMDGRKAIIQSWIDAGKMNKICPEYLLFHIWACTQHYADFSTQITHLKGARMTREDFDRASFELVRLILGGCGLSIPVDLECMEADSN